MPTFKDLGLSTDILKALDKKGFKEPSPIQAETIPLLLEDTHDVIGHAQTGTGKTAAFGLPILERLIPNSGHIQALILTPTRELTIQVCNELISLKGTKPLTVTPIYGGQSIVNQKKQLNQSNDIIVGTPGRVIDHMNSRSLDISNIQYLVLDEADEMLNSGFFEDIERILAKANKNRRTLLFSATMPAPILRLANQTMGEYKTITIKKETLATTLTEQIYFDVHESDKLEALCRIIDVEATFYGLIFCRTKRDVDRITEKLIHRGYPAEAMHGDLSQFQRERVLSKFRKKVCNILVVTDVASRGLDISGLSHVINYALPQDPESYVHRIGRTGRAGQSGTAITFISPSEYRKLTYIQKVAKTDIKKGDIPTIDAIISAKKDRLKSRILSEISSGSHRDFESFAETLLQTSTPTEALLGVLSTAFKKELSRRHYADIQSFSKSNHHRRNKPPAKRGNYPSQSFSRNKRKKGRFK